MSRSLRRSTRLDDAVYVMRRLADATRVWKAGDRCLSYNGREVTTVVGVADSIATLANGDELHVSKMRRAPR